MPAGSDNDLPRVPDKPAASTGAAEAWLHRAWEITKSPAVKRG